MPKQQSHEQTQSIEELMQELLESSEDEVLNPKIPFNKVIFLEKLPEEFNKENRAVHDKFKRLEGVGIPFSIVMVSLMFVKRSSKSSPTQ